MSRHHFSSDSSGEILFDIIILVIELIAEIAIESSKNKNYKTPKISKSYTPKKVSKRVVEEPEVATRDPKSVINHTYDQTKSLIELEVLLTAYVFQQDDGKITMDEARILRKRLRPHAVKLQTSDYSKLKQLVKETHSIDQITQYCRDNNITLDKTSSIINRLIQINDITKRHDRIIDFVKEQLTIELEY